MNLDWFDFVKIVQREEDHRKFTVTILSELFERRVTFSSSLNVYPLTAYENVAIQ